MAVRKQAFNQVGADETGASGNEDMLGSAHEAIM
jgi:hypothetical protein